jgi:hypothetical protein
LRQWQEMLSAISAIKHLANNVERILFNRLVKEVSPSLLNGLTGYNIIFLKTPVHQATSRTITQLLLPLIDFVRSGARKRTKDTDNLSRYVKQSKSE